MEQKLLHSLVQGTGEPLIVLHGYFGMLDNWKSHALKWSAHAEVHLIDQRNHGRSFHDNLFNYKVMAEDLLFYMNKNKIEKAHILGHSMGGKTAMCFAGLYPERIASLVVVDISPKYYPPHHQDVLKAITAVDFSQIEKRSQVDAVFQEYLSDMGTRQFLLKNIYRDPEQGWKYRFNMSVLVDENEAIGEALPEEVLFDGASVLFIKGGDSEYILHSDKELIKKHFPNAEFKTIEGAGHWVHAQNPKAFSETIAAFLNW